MNYSLKNIAKKSPFVLGLDYAFKKTHFELTKDDKF